MTTTAILCMMVVGLEMEEVVFCLADLECRVVETGNWYSYLRHFWMELN